MLTDELVDTTTASRLVGRSVDAIRGAIRGGQLECVTRDSRARPLVSREELLAWASRRPPRTQPAFADGAARTIRALEAIGPATAEELGIFLDIHTGNVRKHLALLARQGDARRRSDGQWSLTALQAAGAA